MREVLAAAAFAVLLAVPAYCADAPRYAQNTMTLSGSFLDFVTDDMDGDGLEDLVVVSLKPGDGKDAVRMVDVFHQKKGGGYPEKPDLSWRLDASAVVFDTGDAGGGMKSFCFLAPDGLYAYLPEGRSYSKKPSRVLSTESIFTNQDPEDLPHWPFFASGAKGRTLALIPGMSSLGVYEKKGANFRLSSRPRLPVETGFSGGHRVGADSTFTISHKMPVVSLAGYDETGSTDIVMNWDDNALVYKNRADGSYTDVADVTFMPGLLGRVKDKLVEGAWLLPADLDGDGRLDFVVTKKTGGVAHTRSLIFIYIRNSDGTIPEKPVHTIITEGVVGPRFVDIDGDGRLDILLPSIKVGIGNFINMLTSGRVNVNVDIYMQGKNGEFLDRPTATKTVEFKLDFADIAKAAPVLETGRFSKEGGYGLAVVSGEDVVSVYLPDRYSILSDRPGLELEVAAPTGMTLTDLNADGADDFVLSYKGSERLSGTLNVFLSKQ